MSDPLSITTIAFLLAFASSVSGYPIPSNMPAPVVTVAPITDTTGCGEEIAGETSMMTGTVTLRPGMSQSDTTCTLAHELTHVLQFYNGHRYGDLEPPAYKVTAACFERLFADQRAVAWAKGAAQTHATGGKCYGVN